MLAVNLTLQPNKYLARTLFSKGRFQCISASAVRARENCSIITYRKSTTSFPTSSGRTSQCRSESACADVGGQVTVVCQICRCLAGQALEDQDGDLEGHSLTHGSQWIFRRIGVMWSRRRAQRASQVYVSTRANNSADAVVRLTQCTADINDWMKASRLRLNPAKTQIMWLGTSQQLEKITVRDVPLWASD